MNLLLECVCLLWDCISKLREMFGVLCGLLCGAWSDSQCYNRRSIIPLHERYNVNPTFSPETSPELSSNYLSILCINQAKNLDRYLAIPLRRVHFFDKDLKPIKGKDLQSLCFMEGKPISFAQGLGPSCISHLHHSHPLSNVVATSSFFDWMDRVHQLFFMGIFHGN